MKFYIIIETQNENTFFKFMLKKNISFIDFSYKGKNIIKLENNTKDFLKNIADIKYYIERELNLGTEQLEYYLIFKGILSKDTIGNIYYIFAQKERMFKQEIYNRVEFLNLENLKILLDELKSENIHSYRILTDKDLEELKEKNETISKEKYENIIKKLESDNDKLQRKIFELELEVANLKIDLGNI